MSEADSSRARILLEQTTLRAIDALARQSGLRRSDLVNEALRRYLADPEVQAELSAPQRRPRLPPATARVYDQLSLSFGEGGAISTRSLAEVLGRNPGNVSRHLAVLRELGYARRVDGEHIPLHPDNDP
jgi:DNA-binding transcriptional ArsR family regulator